MIIDAICDPECMKDSLARQGEPETADNVTQLLGEVAAVSGLPLALMSPEAYPMSRHKTASTNAPGRKSGEALLREALADTHDIMGGVNTIRESESMLREVAIQNQKPKQSNISYFQIFDLFEIF